MPWRGHFWPLVALAIAVGTVGVIAVETGGRLALAFGIVAAATVFVVSRGLVRRKLGRPS